MDTNPRHRRRDRRRQPEYRPDADFSREHEESLRDYYRFPYCWL
jgi:hypothetical protein